MPPLPNVQRLAARGPGSLAAHVVVDVSAILRWMYETHADGFRVWPLLDEAVRRSGRHIVWIVAPCTPHCDGVDLADLDREEQRLTAVYGTLAVIRTHLPLLASLREYLAIHGWISVVTAGLDDRQYQLLPLDQVVDQMLDIGSGKCWTRSIADSHEVEPLAQPELRAIIGAEPGDNGLTRDARKYEESLQHLVLGEKTIDELNLAPWLKQRLRHDVSRVERRTDELRGGLETDAPTIARLTAWVRSTTESPASTYLLPNFDEDGRLVMLHGLAGGQPFFTFGEYIDDRLRALHREDPGRWFVPHGLDLCAWMVDRGLPLPRSVVDPAMAVFILDPDHPTDLADISLASLGYSDDLRAWLVDVERIKPTPEGLFEALDLLPQLDVELAQRLDHEQLRDVLENDLAPTVPVLAKIERQGAWVDLPRGYASWKAVEEKLLRRLRFHEKIVREYLPDVEPYTTTNAVLANSFLWKLASLVPWHWPKEQSRGELFDRFALAGLPAANAIQRARSIDASGLEWVKKLKASDGRLRGHFVPQVTGRFGYREHALQNVPKRGIEGRLLRSALRGPPGYLLFSVDYDSFEGRLLAAVSGDPALLASAQQQDMHAANARLLLGASTPELRSRVKNALYAIGYGQQKRGFVCGQADLSNDEASKCFDAVVLGFPELTRYCAAATADFRATRTATSIGGWRRKPKNAREAINTGIQALAATIFRRVVRQLDIQLAPLEAFVLVQVHDEVIVAARPTSVQAAMQTVKSVMENAALQQPALLPHSVPLFTKLHQGTTWADL